MAVGVKTRGSDRTDEHPVDSLPRGLAATVDRNFLPVHDNSSGVSEILRELVFLFGVAASLQPPATATARADGPRAPAGDGEHGPAVHEPALTPGQTCAQSAPSSLLLQITSQSVREMMRTRWQAPTHKS